MHLDSAPRSGTGRLLTAALVLAWLWGAPAAAHAEGTEATGNVGHFRFHQTEPDAGRWTPEGTALELGLAGFAKVLCSAVFVSGRQLEEAQHNSGYFFVRPDDRGRLDPPRMDLTTRSLSISADGIERTARLHGDQGCVLEPRDGRGIRFDPTRVRSSLPPAEETPWPMGDARPTDQPSTLDAAALDTVADTAFADGSLTQAFLVVHDGRIVIERYAPGVDRETQLESWSMGKSLTATLTGVLIEQGEFDLWDPAPVAEWSDPGDPRSEIRVADLLRMSSGLDFRAPRDPDYDPADGYPDHMYVYTGAIDAFSFALHRPLEFAPATEGRYRNSDPLALGAIIRRTVEARGENYLSWPQRALFDRIGIRRQVLEPDPWGNFLLTGYDYGTARNWARLAMLYLQDGVWLGERILPYGFVEFVSTPAPAWDEPVYGGLFWINGDGRWSLPRTAYYMAGAGGQRVFVVPSHDLVIVRLGHFRGQDVGMAALDDALARLLELVPASRDDSAPGSHLWEPSAK